MRRLAGVDLVGERARLVPVERAHAAEAFRMLFGEEDILRWLVWDGPASLPELEAAYADWITPGVSYRLAILDRETGRFAGTIAPRFSGRAGTADVGYWIGKEFWGRGLMTDAVRLVDHLCFRHLDATVLSAFVFVGNHASRRVLEKNGYRLLHVAKDQVEKRGKRVDEWYFTLVKEDFERASAGWAPVEERVTWG